MERRAFSLTELLVVVAILLVLAALLFPVFARGKERTKLTDCGTRLHQFAAALNLYRADHDDRGYFWSDRHDGHNHFRYPYNMFEGMRGYLGDGTILFCSEPNDDQVVGWRLLHHVTFAIERSDRPDVTLHVPPKPTPGIVVAYCSNHARGPWDPRYGAGFREGDYPFVREDASMGLARSVALKESFYDASGWHDETSTTPRVPWMRFPGEPWPPVPEE